MAKAGYDFPSFETPKFDFNAVVAFHKGNLETAVQAQRILGETASTMAKLQSSYLNDLFGGMKAAQSEGASRKPESYLADAQAATEKMLAVAKEQFELGSKAQNEIFALVSKRASASMDEVKAFQA